ncbi:MAG: hypothetical protein FIA91_02110, partial [Geobacter sp.]|nr:hypothetical protein [Geobacter sp.]
QDLLRRALDSGLADSVDVVWPKADGIDHWYNIYAFPEHDVNGQIISVMTVSRDITQRKNTEIELQKLNEELEERVRERTAALEQKNMELERMNKVFVGRELRMVSLKERIAELETKSGRGERENVDQG